jgi:hypothetical protein
MYSKTRLLAIAFAGLFMSCGSIPHDLGTYNSKNVPEEELATLYIHENLYVQKIDNEKVPRYLTWAKQVARLPSGVHSITVVYNDGTRRSLSSMTAIGQFDADAMYLLKGVINGQRVMLRFLRYENEIEGEDVTLDMNKLQGNDPGVISSYIRYVLNPTMEETGNSVKLENEDYILMYLPDMVYTLTDKKTGITTEGRRGFSMDFRMTSGKAFLLETDITAMSREEFLKSKYEDNAQTVFIPVSCSQDKVTYKYERPENLKGVEITFDITEIKK